MAEDSSAKNDEHWTLGEVRAFITGMREGLADDLAADGDVRPTTILFATCNPETGEKGKQLVEMGPMGSFDDDEREVYATVLRRIAQACGAEGIVFVSEAWSIDPTYLKTLSAEARQREMKEWAGRFSEHPKRVEFILMTVDHGKLGGTMVARAPIRRDAAGKPSLGEWVERVSKSMGGRFVNMLPESWAS